MERGKHEQDRLKAERLKQEEAAQRAEARRRALWFGFAALVICTIAAAMVFVLTGARDKEQPTSTVNGVDAEGFQNDPPPWPPEYDRLAERLAGVSFPPVGDESHHVHALLSVFVNGSAVTVPANVGLGPAIGELALHTHTPDGVVHIEADEPFPFTLGQFFDVWGVKLTDSQIGPFKNRGDDQVRAFVNGNPLPDPRMHEIADGDNIVVGFGKAGSFPSRPDAAALEGQ